MNKMFKKSIGIILSLSMMTVFMPVEILALDASVDDEKAMASEQSESMVSDSNTETSDEEEIITNEIESNAYVLESTGGVTVDADIQNGSIQNFTVSQGKISGKAVAAANYELATVRLLWSVGSEQHEQYVSYKDDCSFEINQPADATNCIVTAFFFSLKKWDGAVDVSWYDPEAKSYEIGTPAELAGLAAITNGMVDENVTAEYMIKDNAGRTEKDGIYAHKYISTESADADLLTPNEGSQVRDKVWRLPEIEKNHPIAEDDIHNDFLYRTVKLTANIDMGDCNWTPIGGKYAMNKNATSGVEGKVIDTRFQGIFDGQGHTVTINCDRITTNLGFAYSWEVALIGYLGGGVDYKNGYPKDVYMDYAKKWIPTVRNVVVKGSVSGRRIVAGVVGRLGETNYGVLVENCANYATVKGTDMRGTAGIVGAAWGKSTIRNCYNAGEIFSGFWEHGGIVGSNGYEGSEGRQAVAADIYNCYNVGDTYKKAINDYKYDGQEIGADGQAFAGYKVVDCYYIQPTETSSNGAYYVGDISVNKKARLTNVTDKEKSYMKSDDFVSDLNKYGNLFEKDVNNINNGYPVFWFQNASKQSSANITIDNSIENGSISCDISTSNVPYGSVVDFNIKPAKEYHLEKLLVTENGRTVEQTQGFFYALSGNDIQVSATFVANVDSKLEFFDEEDNEDYFVTAKLKNQDGSWRIIESGSSIKKDQVISISATLKETRKKLDGTSEPVHPDIKTLEYTGTFGNPIITDYAMEKVSGTNNQYRCTGEVTDIEITFKPKTQGKRWITDSFYDTTWYTREKKEYTLTDAKQLAGAAVLSRDNDVDFEGVTLKLGNDISLANTPDNSGDIFGNERSWFGIGTDNNPFKGTFDGDGHKIIHMHRNFDYGYSDGENGGLFAVTDGATIKNVEIVGGEYANTASDGDAEITCSFKNGANGGAIVGTAIDTEIINCKAELPMDGAQMAGGIVGTAKGDTVIENCTNNSAISGKGRKIGGIVGIVEDNGVVIKNCVNKGILTSTSYDVGGILGYNNGYKVDIINSVNNGNIETNTAYANNANYAIGGLVGYSNGKLTISESINHGDIVCNKLACAVAGIAGSIKGSDAVIINSYNTGDVFNVGNNKTDSDASRISGIANLDTSKSKISEVSNCYNIGKLTVGSSFKSTFKGGVVGAGNVEKVSNNYCSKSSVAAIGNTAGLSGKVLADDRLKVYGYYLGDAYNADGEGEDSINNGYPVLKWQGGVTAEKPEAYMEAEPEVRVRVKKTHKIVVDYDGDGKITYSVANKKIATVSSTGVVKGVKIGTTTVKVKAAATANSPALETTVKIIVPTVLTKGVLTKTSYKYNGKVQKPSVKTLNKKKLKKGTDYVVEIPESCNAGTYYVLVRGVGKYDGLVKLKYNIAKANRSISLGNKTVYVKKTLQLNPISKGTGAYSYKSKSSKIAKVGSKTGIATGVKAGSTKITVTRAADKNYNKATKTIKVTVKKQSQPMVAIVESNEIVVGGKAPITLTGSAGTVTYSSSSTAIATVSKSGVITAKKAGKVTITIKAAGNSTYNAASKKITITVVKNEATI